MCREDPGFHFSLGGDWLPFFQGPDGGGQSLRKGRSQGKGKKKEWDLWPPASRLLCRITIPNTGSSWHAEKQLWSTEQWSACKEEITQSSLCSACCREHTQPVMDTGSSGCWAWAGPPSTTYTVHRVAGDAVYKALFQQTDFAVAPSASALFTPNVEALGISCQRTLH